MRSVWLQRLSNLLCVKIILTVVFAYLSIIGKLSEQDFLTVFSVVIAFYFGTQSQRLNEKINESSNLRE